MPASRVRAQTSGTAPPAPPRGPGAIEAIDSATRRGRSLRTLHREGIRGGDAAVRAASTQRRLLREVARRVVALAIVSGRGRGMTLEAAREALERHGAAPWLARSEVSFLRRSRLTRAEEARAAWNAEACHALLWAIGYVKTLGRPRPAKDPGLALGLLARHGMSGLASRAKLRPEAEILDALDLALCAHAALREMRRLRAPAPDGWIADVVLERLHALAWLVTDRDWDEIDVEFRAPPGLPAG